MCLVLDVIVGVDEGGVEESVAGCLWVHCSSFEERSGNCQGTRVVPKQSGNKREAERGYWTLVRAASGGKDAR